MQLVECVPNFSEGRDQNTIDSIAQAIRSVSGVDLLDVDPGKSTNRTVFTFVGEPEPVLEAAFQSIKRAAALIDMRKHRGVHPRIGATDVCPFVPVSGVTMQECIELSRRLGQRVGNELGIPVYLYAQAAQSDDRKNLADVRKGEYEGLPARLAAGFKPDFGPNEFNAQSGATIIGARKFLIAYNVNLNTRSQKLAHEIARSVRESGTLQRAEGAEPTRVPGALVATKAVGWYVDEYARAQISMNLVDYEKTSLHTAFDECCQYADKLGLRVTGSEIIGLVPLEPMLAAGRHYLIRQGRSAGVSEPELIDSAVISLGLNDVGGFDPSAKIIEYRMQRKEKRLRDLSVAVFCDRLASESPAPGGGSVAAVMGALSASLSAMVANLTFGREGHQQDNDALNSLATSAQRLKQQFVSLMESDAAAFNKIMEANRLPRHTDEEKASRHIAIQTATKEATEVPLRVLFKTLDAVDLARRIVDVGYSKAISDAGVACNAARAAADASYLNVRINLTDIADGAFKKRVLDDAEKVLREIRTETDRLYALILERL